MALSYEPLLIALKGMTRIALRQQKGRSELPLGASLLYLEIQRVFESGILYLSRWLTDCLTYKLQ